MPSASSTDDLLERVPDHVVRALRPILDALSRDAVRRDGDRDLPFDAVAALRAIGFGAARLDRADGGWGLSWPQLAAVLVALAEADSNVPQILRGHLALVEHVLTTRDAAFAARWLQRVAAGELVGNSWSEPSGSTTARVATELFVDGDGRSRVRGTKFYTTGSIFADWTDTVAHRVADGQDVSVLVRLQQDGVEVRDDWDGFGQRLTGTGAIVFDDADVDPGDAVPVPERFGYQTALYQFVLLATLAGIAARAVRDTAAAVRARTRVYSHGNADRVADDPQIQALLGELSGSAFAVRSSVFAVADALERAARDAQDGVHDAAARARARSSADLAELRSAQAQVFATTAVQQLTSRLFDALGASAVARSAGLDRHWRNARTVSSHNPVLFKQRRVGEWELTGRHPEHLWSVGTPAAAVPVG